MPWSGAHSLLDHIRSSQSVMQSLMAFIEKGQQPTEAKQKPIEHVPQSANNGIGAGQWAAVGFNHTNSKQHFAGSLPMKIGQEKPLKGNGKGERHHTFNRVPRVPKERVEHSRDRPQKHAIDHQCDKPRADAGRLRSCDAVHCLLLFRDDCRNGLRGCVCFGQHGFAHDLAERLELLEGHRMRGIGNRKQVLFRSLERVELFEHQVASRREFTGSIQDVHGNLEPFDITAKIDALKLRVHHRECVDQAAQHIELFDQVVLAGLNAVEANTGIVAKIHVGF
jgi:hypothetical protein